MITMTIIQDAMENYEKLCFIDSDDGVLKGIRFARSSEGKVSDDQYINISSHGTDVLCTSIFGKIVIKQIDLDIVYKCICEYSEKIEEWEEDLNNMIFSNCTLQELSLRSQHIINNPFFITDESNHVLATSSHKMGTVNEAWDYILQNKRMIVEVVQDIFNDDLFKSNFYRKYEKPFYFHPPGLQNGAVNFRIPSPNKNGYMGTLVVLDTGNPFPAGIFHYTQIFGKAISRWVRLHYKETPMNSAAIAFEHMVNGKEPTESQKVLLSSIVNSQNGLYKVLAIHPIEGIVLDHYISLFGESLINCVFCNLNTTILILCSESNSMSALKIILNLMNKKIKCIGVSNHFSDLIKVTEFAHQATAAMKYARDEVSYFDSECATTFILEEMKLGRLGASLVHPSLVELREHDAVHNTDYCNTLYTFLKQERSIAPCLALLNIHRNTMIYRLKRIDEILSLDLNDYFTREHLLFSFGLMGIL